MSIKSIVIIGSGRSGTSFIANLLASNGVFTGNCTGGTLENLEVRQINEQCLNEYCGAVTRSSLPYGNLSNGIPDISEKYEEMVKSFVKKMNNQIGSVYEKSTWWDKDDKYWLFKDPRTTILHKLWIKYCDIIIGVYRNPTEVVESYMKLLGVYYSESEQEIGYVNMLNYWKYFNKSLLEVFNTVDDKPKYLLDFNSDIEQQVDNLFNKDTKKIDINKNRKTQNSDSIYDDKEVLLLYDELKKIRNLL